MSEQAKPTPGEWELIESDHFICVGGGPNHDDIAEFNFEDMHTVNISREEAVANATLFLHAREVLAALKAAAAHLEEMRKDPRWHPIGDCPVLNQVRAALAKASPSGEER